MHEVIFALRISPPTKYIVSVLEANKSSSALDVYHVESYDEKVKVFHAAKTEDDIELLQYSINTEYLPLAASSFEREDTENYSSRTVIIIVKNQ